MIDLNQFREICVIKIVIIISVYLVIGYVLQYVVSAWMHTHDSEYECMYILRKKIKMFVAWALCDIPISKNWIHFYNGRNNFADINLFCRKLCFCSEYSCAFDEYISPHYDNWIRVFLETFSLYPKVVSIITWTRAFRYESINASALGYRFQLFLSIPCYRSQKVCNIFNSYCI